MEEFEEHFEVDGQTITEKKTQTKKPRLYWVILLNDDYTPMDFVITVLQTIFHKNLEEATKLMWDVHVSGRGLCGVFPYSVAISKAHHVKEMAKKNKHPLECILEPVDNGEVP